MSLNSFIPTSHENQVTPGAQREAELRGGDRRYYSQILRAAQSAEPLPEETLHANLITMSAAKFMLNYLQGESHGARRKPRVAQDQKAVLRHAGEAAGSHVV